MEASAAWRVLQIHTLEHLQSYLAVELAAEASARTASAQNYRGASLVPAAEAAARRLLAALYPSSVVDTVCEEARARHAFDTSILPERWASIVVAALDTCCQARSADPAGRFPMYRIPVQLNSRQKSEP